MQKAKADDVAFMNKLLHEEIEIQKAEIEELNLQIRELKGAKRTKTTP